MKQQLSMKQKLSREREVSECGRLAQCQAQSLGGSPHTHGNRAWGNSALLYEVNTAEKPGLFSPFPSHDPDVQKQETQNI